MSAEPSNETRAQSAAELLRRSLGRGRLAHAYLFLGDDLGVLEDAARTAQGLGERELVAICTQMARQVEEMAERYENPTDGQRATIQKLTKAFELAKTAKIRPPPAPAGGHQAATA